jgi:hypothetical protein
MAWRYWRAGLHAPSIKIRAYWQSLGWKWHLLRKMRARRGRFVLYPTAQLIYEVFCCGRSLPTPYLQRDLFISLERYWNTDCSSKAEITLERIDPKLQALAHSLGSIVY